VAPARPTAVRCLESDNEDLLVRMQVLKYERRLWVKVRTTNAIERVFRELR
jgi:transposase-like protein